MMNMKLLAVVTPPSIYHMESHKIFVTTANLKIVRKKAKNILQLTKIIWEETLNAAKYTTN